MKDEIDQLVRQYFLAQALPADGQLAMLAITFGTGGYSEATRRRAALEKYVEDRNLLVAERVMPGHN
ncbi:hypothetical protein PTKU46_80760 [Paraburkholderia terrae]|uniref:hypothetical protein n=1 Tax=Paraburkholderia terrae TaxID=311230 RepID=UPI0030E5BFB5